MLPGSSHAKLLWVFTSTDGSLSLWPATHDPSSLLQLWRDFGVTSSGSSDSSLLPPLPVLPPILTITHLGTQDASREQRHIVWQNVFLSFY